MTTGLLIAILGLLAIVAGVLLALLLAVSNLAELVRFLFIGSERE